MVVVIFISCLSLLFKWRRIIFVLVSFEFILMSLMYVYCFVLGSGMFIFFLVFRVVSSLFGLIVLINGVFVYGYDCCVF